MMATLEPQSPLMDALGALPIAAVLGSYEVLVADLGRLQAEAIRLIRAHQTYGPEAAVVAQEMERLATRIRLYAELLVVSQEGRR